MLAIKYILWCRSLSEPLKLLPRGSLSDFHQSKDIELQAKTCTHFQKLPSQTTQTQIKKKREGNDESQNDFCLCSALTPSSSRGLRFFSDTRY